MILWELLKFIVRALEAIELSAVQSALDWIGGIFSHPVPVGYVLVVVFVFVALFWIVRKRLDLWPFGRRASTPTGPSARIPRSEHELRCIGWDPATTQNVQIAIDRDSRMRFALTRHRPGQRYTFYFRFISEGRAPRWIGITNAPYTRYIAPVGNEVSLTETDNASPDVEIHLIDLIRVRFRDFEGSTAVIDRFRLRGDADDLQEVVVSVVVS